MARPGREGGAEEARQALQRLFDAYPVAHQAGLASRIRSPGRDHEAAVVELYVHALLRSCGYTIEVEPTCSGGSRPDYRVRRDGYGAYVEVTTDCGPGEDAREEKALDALLCEARQRVAVRGFQVLIREHVVGKRNTSPRKLANFLNQWLGSFEHAADRARLERTGTFDEMPQAVYEEVDSGWRNEMVLYPTEHPDLAPDTIAACYGITPGGPTASSACARTSAPRLGSTAGATAP